MKNINLDGLDNVKADKELIERTVNKIMNDNKTINDNKTHFNVKKYAAMAASLVLIVGVASLYSLHSKVNSSKESANSTPVHSNNVSNKTTSNNNGTSYDTEESKTSSNQTATDTNVVADKSLDKGQVSANKGQTSIILNLGKIAVNNKETPVKPAAYNNKPSSNEDEVNTNVVTIPAVNLNPSTAVHAKMLALVVYNGKVYTQSSTEFDSKYINSFLGERIGRTSNSINEWNVKDKSTEELASNIGEQDIYTVKGYDSSFRIMSYIKINGQEFAQFFDCLNGITVKSGNDIFGKLKLVDNVENAKFIKFDDWNNGIDNYTDFKNLNILNEALKNLNNAIPYDYQSISEDIDNNRNNNGFREFTLKLKDGSSLKFNVFKNGYVSYGYSNVYFKVPQSIINKLWQ